MRTAAEMRGTLGSAEPPALAAELEALWWAAKGEWERAHVAVQELESTAAAWVHAHLHRQEGDLENAGYWYRRAGKTPSTATLEDEWDAIVAALLEGQEASPSR